MKTLHGFSTLGLFLVENYFKPKPSFQYNSEIQITNLLGLFLKKKISDQVLVFSSNKNPRFSPIIKKEKKCIAGFQGETG